MVAILPLLARVHIPLIPDRLVMLNHRVGTCRVVGERFCLSSLIQDVMIFWLCIKVMILGEVVSSIGCQHIYLLWSAIRKVRIFDGNYQENTRQTERRRFSVEVRECACAKKHAVWCVKVREWGVISALYCKACSFFVRSLRKCSRISLISVYSVGYVLASVCDLNLNRSNCLTEI